MQTGFQPDANRVCRTMSVQQPLPFCHTLSFYFIHTHIIPLCLDQFVAHCFDIIDIQLCCGMGFEHGNHTTFSPSIFHFYWSLAFQLIHPLADLLLYSSISLTCVTVGSSFILCKILHFFSAPFFISFFWLLFGSFLFTFLLSRSQKCFMHK